MEIVHEGTWERHHWKEDFCDVDLVCEGERLEAHIVVISLREFMRCFLAQ